MTHPESPMETTTLSLHYGSSNLSVQVPSVNLMGVLRPPVIEEKGDEQELIRAALANPISSPRLCEMVRPGQKVVIVTSDLTRPCPSERMLPPLLDELATAGVADGDITIVIALGLHRPMSPAELEQAVGKEIYRRVRVINHDPKDTVRLGITSFGTPVEIFRPVVEADIRVCLGNLELHYFAGFSGGAKAILPGCASKTSVAANHAMMVLPEASAGRLVGNPLRADIEEGVAMVGVDFILNVIVDGEHHILGAFAGEVTAAQRRGCIMVAARAMTPIERKAEIVLVSAGGYPKDVNFYQAHKALETAAYAVRDGGVIILAAECREGFGHQVFEEWMSSYSPDELLRRIREQFVLGGHKAAAIAVILKRARIFLISSLPDDLVRRCKFEPFDDLQNAFETALAELGPQASSLVMPYGGSTLPVLKPVRSKAR
jgi:nickel-dependent lactate racemase